MAKTRPDLFDEQAEAQAFGAALNNPDLFLTPTFDPDDFHTELFRDGWRIAGDLLRSGVMVDSIVLEDALIRKGYRLKPAEFTILSAKVENELAAPRHLEIIADYAARRRMDLAVDRLKRAVHDGQADFRSEASRVVDLVHTMDQVPAEQANGSTWEDMRATVGPICWDWPSWLVRGLLTILAGEQASGKSSLALRVAACYLLGLPWPDGKPFTGEQGSVVWVEAEAAQAVNLERAQGWGLPLERILSPLEDGLIDVQFDNAVHRRAIASVAQRPDVRLIVVDSLSGGNSRDENSAEMGPIVKWLAELARDNDKPVILTHHLRKRGLFDSGERVGLERVRGHSSITQTARMVWTLDAPDLNDPDTKRLSVSKSNLAKFPEPIGLSISEAGVTFVAPPEAPRVETQLDKAIDLLQTLLRPGPMTAVTIFDEAEQMAISKDTVRRAKDKLGLVVRKDGPGGQWRWGLPGREDERLM